MKINLLLLSFLFPLYGIVAQVNIELVAYYPFNGNAQDASGNANHGTVVGAGITSDRFGNPNSAYLFNGAGDYISLFSNEDLQISFPFTVTCWISLEEYAHSPVFTNNYAQNNYFGVQLNIVNGYASIGFGDSGPTGPGFRRSFTSTTTKLALNRWYHITGIVRGPLDMELYVDGIRECGEYSGSGGAMVYDGQPGAIGRTGTAQGITHFKGSIDEVRFYSWALSLDQIIALQDSYVGVANQDTTICAGEQVRLDAGVAASYRWSPAAGLSCTNCQTPIARPSQTTVYQVVALINNCYETVTEIEIKVQDCSVPCVAPLPSPFVTSKDFVATFTDTTTGADSVVWELEDGTRFEGVPGDIFVYTYGEYGRYEVCIETQTRISGNQNCVKDTCIEIHITPPFTTYFIPSAFSPNGDGINDEWFVSGVYIENISITIFSRWGMKVATLNQLNQPWDGRSQGGTPLPEGVYIFRMEAILNSGRYAEESGTFTLLR